MQNNESNKPSSSIVERLYRSFADLEAAISGARETLRLKTDVPADVFQRLDSYDEIIARQRGLARDLEQFIAAGDMLEISRHVMIINSLSGMIIDDAKQILASLSSLSERDALLRSSDQDGEGYRGKLC
jgi:hypothetical protein